MGVAWQTLVAVAADELIWIAITGRFHWDCANFTNDNYGLAFADQVGVFFDNPADLNIQAAGDGGAIGVLDHVTSTAVSGWINISNRTDPTHA